MMNTVIEDLREAARSGRVTLEAQLRASDLLDSLYEAVDAGASLPESAPEYCVEYEAIGRTVAAVFDPALLAEEAALRLHPFVEAMEDARYEAATAASLHEFAKEVHQIWQTSGIFARRRALRELRRRAGFRLESNRIGNYVAKTFDLMNEARSRFAMAQQAVFANDVSYKCRRNLYAEIASFLQKRSVTPQDHSEKTFYAI